MTSNVRPWDPNNKYSCGFLKRFTYWTLEVSYRQHTLGCYIIFLNRAGVQLQSDISFAESMELVEVMKMAESAVRMAFMPDHFNYLQMGNALKWLHFHGIPRYEREREFEEKTWVDPTWGMPPLWCKTDFPSDMITSLRDTLASCLASCSTGAG